ncbi:pyridoxamine 5'-phosphate oxidase family protein [Amycolatopsis sp. NBC_00355]|uniref:pyridoxamine 5'-phosphate oxidase family protein n=1 Tax=Amycolatopsis sp. NBC_00355 TaxID=2975957 RepID=UPI002E270359
MADDVGFGLLLDRAQCLALLRTASLGRVIFTHRAMPAVRPVRFTVVGESVVFAVPEGSPLYAGARDAVVAFEADDFADDLGAGWFVSLLGRAGEFRDSSAAEIACLCPCSSRAGRRFLQIPVETITGHRMACPAE